MNKQKGWRGESYRHYLAAKGIKTTSKSKRYYSTYTAADLPLIVSDGVGTAGAAGVALIPVAVPLLAVAGGVVVAKKTYDKTSKSKKYKSAKYCLSCGAKYNVPLMHPYWRSSKCPVCNSDASIAASDSEHDLPDAVFAKKEKVVESTAPGKVDKVNGIPIKAEAIEPNQIYPVSIDDVKRTFTRMKKEDLEGIESIEFKKPVGEQKDAYGQYIRSKKRIYVFAQPFEKGKVDGEDPEQVRKHIINYVLPHEVGHHKALHTEKIYDKNLNVAEARADANVIGLAPNDKAIKKLAEARGH
jgi:hypothetical protein